MEREGKSEIIKAILRDQGMFGEVTYQLRVRPSSSAGVTVHLSKTEAFLQLCLCLHVMKYVSYVYVFL